MSVRRGTTLALALLTATGLLTACGASDPSTDLAAPKGRKDTGVNIGPDQDRLRGKKVAAAAGLVPEAIRERGTLRLGASAEAVPPLGFYATDDRTRIGSEIDIATLVADTLGLKPEFEQVSWENLFVGLDSAKFDGVLSNVTVTEERKEKYDFATYRLDNIAFEAKKGSGWKVREPADVAGKTISVSSGTNQEKILVEWSEKNVEAGREPVDIKYFQKDTDYYLALQSGRIDAHLGPSPVAAYHVASAGQSEIVGQLSGAGGGLQGKIAATTKKGSGLVEAYAAAIDHIVRDGSYGKVLERWGLSGEAVEKSEINPPGLPKAKS
ncbi:MULTISPECIES: ABC transporter substrate-binding protein [Streptomyces]|uniref:ABC transporter substrate-binding protein n=1 Tax=Streptomyces TaxID=1883 RepID=UPI000241A3F7|nr:MULTISPECIES: ABC transporter substrate-binding protein [Streptomyces]EHM30025.1 putative ABC transporter substrate-binding protein [Streptomyces sp. W007]MCX4483701.1 ABC transporter substrate-binding protein [Streptomyces anulatus]MCX4517358.1 ABC transporter substrate-binding protein [Streptomyces anulatus]MCX4600189.1 ABC transporter substrate-binding protein [Streptomyces anulatus]WSU72691.1 ABC transporter substrate-binding protein [Streptomyces anulatus]